MPLTKNQLRSIEPYRGELEEPTEPPNAYAARVREVLPNFPESVIAQWFQDHHGIIPQYAWLDYPRLSFRLASFDLRELALPGLAEHPTVVQYRDYFVKGVDSLRLRRLAEFMRDRGTWPVPPILVDTSERQIESPWGLKYSRPYDVLEGHHRMAVLYGLQLHVTGEHAVWLVTR